jgi:hypothetical protein
MLEAVIAFAIVGQLIPSSPISLLSHISTPAQTSTLPHLLTKREVLPVCLPASPHPSHPAFFIPPVCVFLHPSSQIQLLRLAMLAVMSRRVPVWPTLDCLTSHVNSSVVLVPRPGNPSATRFWLRYWSTTHKKPYCFLLSLVGKMYFCTLRIQQSPIDASR